MTFAYSAAQQDAIAWFQSKGFIFDRGCWGIAWSCRAGMDFTDLEFYPLGRRADDPGWDAIVGHHASGTNPRLVIGRCETLADLELVYNTIRHINGYPGPEPELSPRVSETTVAADQPEDVRGTESSGDAPA